MQKSNHPREPSTGGVSFTSAPGPCTIRVAARADCAGDRTATPRSHRYRSVANAAKLNPDGAIIGRQQQHTFTLYFVESSFTTSNSRIFSVADATGAEDAEEVR
jgi:hypothetical protein